MTRLLSVSVLLLAWSLPAIAAPPKGVTTELSRWLKAVQSESPDAVAALLPAGAKLLVQTEVAVPPKPDRALDRESLLEALRAGEANALGLDRHLLLPRARDLRRIDGRWEARDKRCPEVRWVFERDGRAWRLTRIVRVPLEC